MHISKHNETEMLRLSDEELRNAILDLTKEYSRRKHINSGFGDSKISFNTSKAASYLKQAESNLDIANQYVKAMNYAVDNGFVSNTELSKLHDGSDVPKLIEHCLVLDSDAPSSSTASTRVGQELQAVTESGDQRYNEDLMALLPKMMGSVAKRGGSSAEKKIVGGV